MAERERQAERSADREAALARAEGRGHVLWAGASRRAVTRHERARFSRRRRLYRHRQIGHVECGARRMGAGRLPSNWRGPFRHRRRKSRRRFGHRVAHARQPRASMVSRVATCSTSHDVLVIDEAGMVGSRQMECILSEAEKPAPKLCWSAIRSSLRRSRRGQHSGRSPSATARSRSPRSAASGRTGNATPRGTSRAERTGDAIRAYDEHGPARGRDA